MPPGQKTQQSGLCDFYTNMLHFYRFHGSGFRLSILVFVTCMGTRAIGAIPAAAVLVWCRCHVASFGGHFGAFVSFEMEAFEG
jgi:hypothetical protein